MTAKRRMNGKWKSCSEDVDQKCFNHCFRKTGDRQIDLTEDVDKSALQSVELDATEHDVRLTCNGLSSCLNSVEEDQIIEKVRREDPVRDLPGISKVMMNIFALKEADNGDDTCSEKRQLRCLPLTKAIFGRRVGLSSTYLKVYVRCTCATRLEKQRKLELQSLLDIFRKE